MATRDLLDSFAVTFDSYWPDPTYKPYDPDPDPDRDGDRLDDALA
ncbi:MAG: hypothetical protein WD250_05040 [Egibacteraceae bacterium]